MHEHPFEKIKLFLIPSYFFMKIQHDVRREFGKWALDGKKYGI
jgi:hypothetical protein